MISYVFNVSTNYNIHISPQVCIHILISKPDVFRRGLADIREVLGASSIRSDDEIRRKSKSNASSINQTISSSTKS